MVRMLEQRSTMKVRVPASNKAMSIRFQILLVTTLLIQSISSEYGPSILSLLQPTRPSTSSPFLNKSNDGRPVESRILHLEEFPNFAAVLPLAEGRSWIRSEEIIEIIGKESLNHAMPFIVVPPPGHGMMVVIQELQIPAHNTFNRSLLVIDENGRIMECFSKFMFQIEGKFPVQVCGRTNDRERFMPSVLDGVGPRSFIVPEGKSITVNFIFRDEQIDNKAALSKQVPFYDIGYLFRGSIAFTAYRSCPNGPPYYDEINAKLWPCDIPQSNREPVSACVREDVFCDHIINCGFHNTHEFGVDERFCKKWESHHGAHSNHNMSHRHKATILDPPLLEEAIHSRIINSDRPFNYNDRNQVYGVHSTRPRPELGGDYSFTTETMESDFTHPAFVTLVILISIICVLIVGLLFRYCCKRCFGKSDHPFAESSNPEALARFHENLRTRDNEVIGRPASGYGLSSDSLFKPPSEDMPPSYDDLFPKEILQGNTKTLDDNNFMSSQLQPSSSRDPNFRGRVPSIRYDYPGPPSTSIYTIPIQQRPPPPPIPYGENEHHSPMVQLGVVSGSSVISNQAAEVRDAGGGVGGGEGVVAVINNRPSARLSNNRNQTRGDDDHHPDHHHNTVDNQV